MPDEKMHEAFKELKAVEVEEEHPAVEVIKLMRKILMEIFFLLVGLAVMGGALLMMVGSIWNQVKEVF